METLFETNAANTLVNRVASLTPAASRQWGKMDVAQMMAHCCEGVEMGMGSVVYRHSLIGKLIGRRFKHLMLDKEPLKKNMPTDKNLLVADQKNFELEKTRLSSLIKKFHSVGRTGVKNHIHPFFGMMTTEEWGRSAWKHLDHHLKQFNA